MAYMESHVRETIPVSASYHSEVSFQWKKLKWAAARLLFMLCSALGVTTVVGSYVLSPLFCYWFFGDLRFWKYLYLAPSMIIYTYYLTYLYLRGRSVPSIPLTAPPVSEPNLAAVHINPEWEHGESCGDCGKCCRRIRCPFQDKANGQCMSYNTFYWRYFNCGRYPASQIEIDLYECPKWVIRP